MEEERECCFEMPIEDSLEENCAINAPVDVDNSNADVNIE
jgi:hypothetical protein